MIRRYLRETVGDMEWDMTLQEAEDTKVLYKGKEVRLKWIATHYPKYLEEMMNRYQPGTKLFWAVQLVYNNNEAEMRIATKTPKCGNDYIPRYPRP